MARSKYSEEVVTKILDAIRQTGSDRTGWEAGGVSEATFYLWCKKYSEFLEQIKEAKNHYRETCPEVLVAQAQKAFADYLFGRVEISQSTLERGVNDKGSYTKEITRRIRLSPPRWAIERVLGKPLDVVEALKILAEAGFIPYWVSELAADEMGNVRKTVYDAFAGILPESQRNTAKPGISEETAGRIRAEILGINAPGASPLSSAVGGGQVAGEGNRKVSPDRD